MSREHETAQLSGQDNYARLKNATVSTLGTVRGVLRY